MSTTQDDIPTSRLAACPHCHDPLVLGVREVWCANNHRFDRAKEGFVNLLRPGRSRKAVIGDDADMVSDRRRFLDRGHYAVLSEGLAALTHELADASPVATLLDVGCGEGSFTRSLAEAAPQAETMAFDISRPAVRLTAKRVPGAFSAVASVMDMPVLDASVDLLCSIMAPLHEAEFARVVRPGGRILVVSPGDSHLAELRRLIYPHYRPHDELVALAQNHPVVERRRFTATVQLATPQELHEVWGMTPYRWNTPLEGQERLAQASSLEVQVHFVATVFSA
ncbi:putative RNA methyltransferase [Luteococcus peritonei]|uniref:RNA methyltransferase n=1 Tax=Luteococcus peritonei TaxID=88874 RepID=A0ABW4RVS8_9ACTN